MVELPDHIRERYFGRILKEKYSQPLQERVRGRIEAFYRLEKGLARVMPYISAWQDEDNKIWYEYVDRRLAELFLCFPEKVAGQLQSHIIDRRSYKYIAREEVIREEVITRNQLNGYRQGLREEVKNSGMVEAVYKLALPDESILWLKDWAVTEYFEADGLNLSWGSLTDVTKEMDHKEVLEQIGYFDELTKLPKRNIMQRILEINIGQVQRRHLDNFVFLMMDIDHFKAVNDNHGHQAGDHILAALAEVMASVKRKEDEIGRYAGEEFYGISHGNIDSGKKFAERLRRIIEKTPFIYEGKKIPITISIGVAVAGELPDLTSDNLIATADRRLYAAKIGGRNRVVCDDGEP
jgi:diguanylate cyclase (GGDEF)-like protein